jgi:hypothetical protein
MTQNNSGYVAKYDGQPMPAKPKTQFGESLDDIAMTGELEQPVRKPFPSAGNYTAIVPAPNYAIQKN